MSMMENQLALPLLNLASYFIIPPVCDLCMVYLAMQTFVEDNKSLQLQLVKELFHFNDTSAAVKWAVKCNLPVDQLPYAVQVHLDTQR